MPPEHVPQLVLSVAVGAGSVKPYHHWVSAQDTARRYVERLPVTGMRALEDSWPEVAKVLSERTSTRTEERLRQMLAEVGTPTRSVAESVAAMEQVLRTAPDGLTVIRAECGLGKTRAAMTIAAERAGRTGRLHRRTSISLDKNTLAVQVARDLTAAGVPVQRLFGPLSVVGADECRYAESARPLVEGGQTMAWELCEGRGVERCEHYATCRARLGAEGPDDAAVVVGTHALLGQLEAEAGSTGLLVIDEPPALLEGAVITPDDLRQARRHLGAFDGVYGAAMEPALDAFAAWLEDARPEEPVPAAKAALKGASAVREGVMKAARRAALVGPVADVVACAKGAMPADRRSSAPPLLRQNIAVAKRLPSFARELGAASKVLRAVHDALTSEGPVTVRAEEQAEARVLVFTRAREDLAAALRREGPVVVTDANADLHVPILQRVVGYPPRFHEFAAADGAPIQRTLLRCRSATRKGWMAHGRVVLEAGVVGAVRAMLEWAGRDPATRALGLITFRPLRVLLEAARRPGDPDVRRAAEELGQPAAALREAEEKLGPLLAAWPWELRFGHYGATRGLNTMADVDALVTLADPWQNLGEVRSAVAFLGLETSWEARVEALCRGELEQAHGRLRAVHRTRPGRALHVGNVLPGGAGWSRDVEVLTLKGGHAPGAQRRFDPDEVRATVDRLGGIRAAARALGCSPATVAGYYAGVRPTPQAVGVALETAESR